MSLTVRFVGGPWDGKTDTADKWLRDVVVLRLGVEHLYAWPPNSDMAFYVGVEPDSVMRDVLSRHRVEWTRFHPFGRPPLEWMGIESVSD